MSRKIGLQQYLEVEAALGRQDFSNRLMHYTSIDAFQRILESNEIWFGRLDAMNDGEEIDLFFQSAVDKIGQLITQADPHIVKTIATNLIPQIRSGTYVSSWTEYFSTDEDGAIDLWERYADGGGGVAIVVDSSQFVPSAIKEENVNFWINASKMLYIQPHTAINLLNDMIRRLSNIPHYQENLNDQFFLAMCLLAKAPLVKRNGWRSEGEVRLIAMKGHREILGMPFEGDLVTLESNGKEYYRFPLKNYPEHGFDFSPSRMLKMVLVGPGPDQEKRCDFVEHLLREHGLPMVDVVPSGLKLKL